MASAAAAGGGDDKKPCGMKGLLGKGVCAVKKAAGKVKDVLFGKSGGGGGGAAPAAGAATSLPSMLAPPFPAGFPMCNGKPMHLHFHGDGTGTVGSNYCCGQGMTGWLGPVMAACMGLGLGKSL